MSFAVSTTARAAQASARVSRSRTTSVHVLPARVPTAGARTRVVVRAAQEEDPAAKLNEQLTKAGDWIKTKWQETDDSEKPAAVAIIIGAVVAQIAIGATVDAVDRLPFIQQFLEFVGLAVVGVYGWRYITDPAERENVKKSIESFVDAVTGK